jgi:hypothetical protein
MQTSERKIVAQERYASRLPPIAARQDYLGEFYPGLAGLKNKNVTEITRLM